MKKYLILLLFLILNSTFIVQNSFSQWVQQSVPVTGGSFNDMKFVNANTGFIAHSTNVLLKTTNAGYNWAVNKNGRMSSLTIVDSMYYYGVGYNNQYGKLYKTTNGGITWDSSLSSFGYSFWKSYFLNRDTGLISSSDSFDNQIWITTDGGQTKQLVATYGGASQGTFHFLKEKVNGEYYGWYYYQANNILYQTTNSGLSWQQKPNLASSIYSIFFVNKDTGWATMNFDVSYVLYTTNGGNNWVNQNLPFSSICYDVCFANSRTGWIGRNLNNKIFATTNGGLNWGFQTVPTLGANKLFFLDSLYGWAGGGNVLSHTTNGGGVVNSINYGNQYLTNHYTLFQNYPNPFNPSTNISYFINQKSYVIIKIYNTSGKEIETLTNKENIPGEFTINWNASNYSSGIYFYKMIISDKMNNIQYSATKKMIYVK